MATAKEIRDLVDATFDPIWKDILVLQEEYFAKTGQYFQGIRTPTTIPKGGVTETPDVNVKPTDSVDTWDTFGIEFPAKIPMSVKIDVYDGVFGKGYVGTVYVDVNEKEFWKKEVNVGPEDWRNTDWVLTNEKI